MTEQVYQIDTLPESVRNVVSTDKGRIVYGVDLQGGSFPLGNYYSTVYQDADRGNPSAHWFVPVDASEKIYKLAATKKAGFKVIDPLQQLTPYLDNGFTIRNIEYSRSGLDFSAKLNPPVISRFDDDILWDRQLWGADYSYIEDGLQNMLAVWGSLRPGKALKGMWGLFRFLCLNGLVDSAYNFGTIVLNHKSWTADKVYEKMIKNQPSLDEDKILGQFVAKASGAKMLAKNLGILIDPNLTIEQEMEIVRYGTRTSFETIRKQPAWFNERIVTQLNLIGDHFPTTALYEADFICMATNAVNLAKRDDSRRRDYQMYSERVQAGRSQNSVTTALATLMSIYEE